MARHVFGLLALITLVMLTGSPVDGQDKKDEVLKVDARLFAAVLGGDHLAKGFRNQDIRIAVFGSAKENKRRQRHSAAIGRILKRLHVRGLVKKVAHTRLWRVTERGRAIMGDTLRTYRRYNAQAA